MTQCLKCSGEMREGEVFTAINFYGVDPSSAGFGMMGMPGTVFPSLQSTREVKPQWREKTGRKTGMVVKSDEENIMRVSGRRCLACGYLELYVQEQ